MARSMAGTPLAIDPTIDPTLQTVLKAPANLPTTSWTWEVQGADFHLRRGQIRLCGRT